MKNVLERAPTSRKVYVCAKNGCKQCRPEVREPPKDCPYAILHFLAVEDGGVRAMPRQSGKTTEIVKMANELTGLGHQVYIITDLHEAKRRLPRMYGLDEGVRVGVESSAPGTFRGYPPGYVLFDEVLPQGVRKTMNMMCGSILVAAYYTPR